MAKDGVKPWLQLQELIAGENISGILTFLDTMSPTETALTISRLNPADQGQLLGLLNPPDAAEVIEDIHETQAAEIIDDLPPEQAAAILGELDSDHVVDLLGKMDEKDAAAILDEMAPEEAREARQFLEYSPETAGGLMASEYLFYRAENRISDVLTDLQANRDTYAYFHVQYLYVTDDSKKLVGVLRMDDLLFLSHASPLKRVMISNPLKVRVDASLEELRNFFEEHQLYGVPVVDEQDVLLGVVLPEAVEEATSQESVDQFLGVSGIVGGEEFRSMPLLVRSRRRLSWLSLNIVLNVVAASVIAFYQDTLAAAIALAVFLPMISDMSGCSGNQAVAVSMRELSLGLIRPNELVRVMAKEASLGIINGICLGILLGGAAFIWKGNVYLGLVVGGALAINTIVAVTLGGLLPLLLKRLQTDPALVSSPLLTTVTDMCGFFLVLGMASTILERLGR